MEKLNREEIQLLFEEEIAKTKQTIADYKEMSQPVAPDDAIGRVSRMDAINNQSITEAALRKAEEKLKGLEVRLSRLNEQSFDKCARCGREIPIGRLLYVPQSAFCLNCAH